MKHSLSPERPQMVENFFQLLMEEVDELPEGQVRGHAVCVLALLPSGTPKMDGISCL